MRRGLADFALRRPQALMGAAVTLVAIALLLAAGAPENLGIGSTGLDDGTERAGGRAASADPLIVTRSSDTVGPRAYAATLDVVASGIRADSDVARVREGATSHGGSVRTLEITLVSGLDDAERQDAVERIAEEMDPGSLRVDFGGETSVLLDARDELGKDLWRLELLAIPFAVLTLLVLLGPWAGIVAAIAATGAIAGALALLRAVGVLADVSLFGIAPAAVLGLTLGIELAALLVSRYRQEAALANPLEAIERAVGFAGRVGLLATAAATAAGTGVLASGLDQGPSLVLGLVLAGLCATGAVVLAGPAMIGWRVAVAAGPHREEDSRLDLRLGRPAGWLARSAPRAALALVPAVVALLGVGAIALSLKSVPFSAGDLPAGAPARVAAQLARLPADGGGGSLGEDLPLAAGVSAGALLLVLLAAFRSVRLIPLALVALLPAAAACGLCVGLFQEGRLADALGQEAQGALETGAIACVLVALAGVGASRAIAAVSAVRAERGLGIGPEGAAELGGATTLAGAAAASLIAAAGAGVLVGSDLYAAREFGLAVAAGLLLDLLLVRLALLAALARWSQ